MQLLTLRSPALCPKCHTFFIYLCGRDSAVKTLHSFSFPVHFTLESISTHPSIRSQPMVIFSHSCPHSRGRRRHATLSLDDTLQTEETVIVVVGHPCFLRACIPLHWRRAERRNAICFYLSLPLFYLLTYCIPAPVYPPFPFISSSCVA